MDMDLYLPVIFVVEESKNVSPNNVFRTNEILNDFHHSFNRDYSFYTRTLVVSNKSFWAEKEYVESIRSTNNYSIKESNQEINLKRFVKSLKKGLAHKQIKRAYCAPIIFFFLSSPLEKDFEKQIKNMIFQKAHKVVVSFSNENQQDNYKGDQFVDGTKKDAISVIRNIAENYYNEHIPSPLGQYEREAKIPHKLRHIIKYFFVKLFGKDKYDDYGSNRYDYHSGDELDALKYDDREIPSAYIDDETEINYALIAETEIKRNTNFVIDFVMYEDDYSAIIEKVKDEYKEPSVKSGAIRDVEKGSPITVKLSSPDLPNLHDEETFVWRGKYERCSLSGFVDKNCSSDNILLVVEVFVYTLKVTTIKTPIDLSHLNINKILSLIKEDVKKIFFSYSSSDRDEVIDIVEKIHSIFGNQIDYFVDVLSLRAGDKWEEKIYQEIDSSDTFCLVWSENAYHSVWVDREWHYALKTKGLSAFNPINLESNNPAGAPIPEELSSVHFANYQVLKKT